MLRRSNFPSPLDSSSLPRFLFVYVFKSVGIIELKEEKNEVGVVVELAQTWLAADDELTLNPTAEDIKMGVFLVWETCVQMKEKIIS